MGRRKRFSREGVLEKALKVFWKYGFAETSVQELERATGVNKSGLYSEFVDKGDLYLQSLRHYLRKRQEEELLTATPLGWQNIERFLQRGPCRQQGQKGCFSVNSLNQLAVLPPGAKQIVARSRASLKDLLARNIEAERPSMKGKPKPTALAEMILTFFTGIAMEQHLEGGRAPLHRRVDDFMKVIRGF